MNGDIADTRVTKFTAPDQGDVPTIADEEAKRAASQWTVTLGKRAARPNPYSEEYYEQQRKRQSAKRY